MKLFLTSMMCLLFSSYKCFSQNDINKWTDRYVEVKLTSNSICEMMDFVDFKPLISKTDKQSLKHAILRMTSKELDQLTRDSWNLCSSKNDDYYEIWQKYYSNKVQRSDWEKSATCVYLMALMCIDGTAKPPKK